MTSRPASKAFLKALTESRGPIFRPENEQIWTADINRPFFNTIFERAKGSDDPWRFGSNGFASMDDARAAAKEMTEISTRTEYRAVQVGDVEAAVAEAIAAERARIRGWLGQQAGKADRQMSEVNGGFTVVRATHNGRRVAFKEAADYLKPPKVKAGLATKRAARAAGKVTK